MMDVVMVVFLRFGSVVVKWRCDDGVVVVL